jgi:hypothetical protein
MAESIKKRETNDQKQVEKYILRRNINLRTKRFGDYLNVLADGGGARSNGENLESIG